MIDQFGNDFAVEHEWELLYVYVLQRTKQNKQQTINTLISIIDRIVSES